MNQPFFSMSLNLAIPINTLPRCMSYAILTWCSEHVEPHAVFHAPHTHMCHYAIFGLYLASHWFHHTWQMVCRWLQRWNHELSPGPRNPTVTAWQLCHIQAFISNQMSTNTFIRCRELHWFSMGITINHAFFFKPRTFRTDTFAVFCDQSCMTTDK